MELDWNKGELNHGLQCYEAREFFEAHEHWEHVWLQASEPEKTFLQGIIQVTAALYHVQQGNLRGARSLLGAALAKLNSYPKRFHRVRVDLLREDANQWRASLARQQPTPELRSPRIEIEPD